MVCARAYLIASSMTLLTCNLFLFSWAKSLQKKRTVVWPRDGCSATSSSSYYSNHKTRKKKCKKNTQTDDEKDETKMRRRIFLSFFSSYERDVDFLMYYFWFLVFCVRTRTRN